MNELMTAVKSQHESDRILGREKKVVRTMIKEIVTTYEKSLTENDIILRIDSLENKIKELENNKLCIRIIGDDMAQEEIKAYLIEQKSLGINKISLVDIVDRLKLPVEQIERIMEKMKTRGVKELV